MLFGLVVVVLGVAKTLQRKEKTQVLAQGDEAQGRTEQA
jgi:hypothetical protein